MFFVVARAAAATPDRPKVAPDARFEAIRTDSSAYELLGRLCDDWGGRLTGSAANNGAMAQLAAALRELGLDPHFDRFRMPGWVRADDTATMVAPVERRLRVAAVGYTNPSGAVTADVVDLGRGRDEDFAGRELRGRIGLLGPDANVPAGGVAAIAQLHGLSGILMTDRVAGGELLCRTGSFHGVPLAVPVFAITQEEGLWMQRLIRAGKPVRVRLHARSRCEEIETANLVVTLPGRTPERIVVGAHFDSWDLGQGAIDNGLGIAQLYALAKHLRSGAAANLRTIELVWFNGEEEGLWGSRHEAAVAAGAPVAAMVNLDMVGYPLGVNALGCDNLLPELRRFAAGWPKSDLPDGVQNVCWMGSDHTSYQLAGVRCITFGARIDPGVVRYYHDFADTFDKVDPKMVGDSAAMVAALAQFLANDADLPVGRRTPAAVEADFARAGLVSRLRALGLLPPPKTSPSIP
ncbi:MAG TPA: M28 family peptidase [Opitutaceae bacterium]|nr:M28 family peptidase [Opitutaceae bacterium]